MPATWEASEAARERAASLLTVPLSVATWSLTADWMASLLMAPSPAMRLWTAAVRLASSVGADGEDLQPARVNARLRAKARAVTDRVAREMERFLLTFIEPLFLCNDNNTQTVIQRTEFLMHGVRLSIYSRGTTPVGTTVSSFVL
jgi:hypothetical protein